MKYGKKYADSIKAYDRTKQYDLNEALGLVLESAKAKFDETVELHVRLVNARILLQDLKRETQNMLQVCLVMS